MVTYFLIKKAVEIYEPLLIFKYNSLLLITYSIRQDTHSNTICIKIDNVKIFINI